MELFVRVVRENTILPFASANRERKSKRKNNKKTATYNTRRCLSPAKSALVILVRLFAFRSLVREMVEDGIVRTIEIIFLFLK